jgi:hypothetical protein
MSESIEVPKKLRSAVLFNVANDLLLSFSLFFFPEAFFESSGWFSSDPFAVRLIAAGLTAVAIEFYLIRNDSIAQFKSVLNIKVTTLGIGFCGVTMAIIESTHKPIIAEWILLGGLLIPFIQLGYWRLHIVKLERDQKLNNK